MRHKREVTNFCELPSEVPIFDKTAFFFIKSHRKRYIGLKYYMKVTKFCIDCP